MQYLSEVGGQGGIYARVVEASISNEIPLYTLEIRAPKFLDAEFEKHRMLSSNSSSSRAMPIQRTLNQVLTEPFIPFDWRKNQKGMQGYEPVDDPFWCKDKWLLARDEVVLKVRKLANIIEGKEYPQGQVHKQTVNRLLEPWLYQKKVVTATEWSNFFNLRLAKDAQPEIQELARCMKEAIEKVTPKLLKPGEWHLPYVSDWESDEYFDGETWQYPELSIEQKNKCSVARCARCSYYNLDFSTSRIEADLDLHDKLLKAGHLTPFEHQATPMKDEFINDAPFYSRDVNFQEKGITHVTGDGHYWSANFKGWIQYRQPVA